MNCPICSSKQNKRKYKIEKFVVIECPKCGLIRLDHDFSFDKVKKLYKKQYFNNPVFSIGYIDYAATERSLRLNFLKRAKRISRSVGEKQIRLLDVGTSTGYFISECSKLNIIAEGIELSEEAVDFARSRLKLTVFKSALEDFRGKKQYDVISAWDVIEHSSDPNKFLKKVNSLLVENGKFFFTTGDVQSVCSKLSGKRWHLFNLPDHLFFYSKGTITKLLKKNKFVVKSITYPWNYYELGYLIERFLKKVVGLKNVKLIKFLAYNFISRNIIIPFNLFDIMEVEAIKK
ncbi:MAG: bifunctional 3-demethylubiquinone-9 3-methyltransferase/ 2-octaprenyl-6-hydroxy phenol methylase [Parcubacteria group bacterium ADurb.Bin326]|nr:MAG: bifunctional 3-demethylubiquinone-9 3-methyltransferase/ 2-octaprenyl-6-hydroxy phenol methylase [Parcubacteria group bacterium ADurb.Bin326]